MGTIELSCRCRARRYEMRLVRRKKQSYAPGVRIVGPSRDENCEMRLYSERDDVKEAMILAFTHLP